MDDTLETLRRKRAHAKQRGQQEVATLCAELEALLAHPPDTNTLEKQAGVLDSMLRAVMRRNLTRDKAAGYIDKDNLDLALRIQKQCMDTLKTRAAIDYMDAITKNPNPSPHPLKMLKQSEGS